MHGISPEGLLLPPSVLLLQPVLADSGTGAVLVLVCPVMLLLLPFPEIIKSLLEFLTINDDDNENLIYYLGLIESRQ